MSVKTLNPYTAGLLIILVFSGTVFFSIQAGYWEKGRVFIRGSGGAGLAQVEIQSGFEEIRNSTSLEEVAAITGLPLEIVYSICGNGEIFSPGTTLSEVREITGLTRRKIVEALYQTTKQ